MKIRLPNLLLAGAAKSGTTSLYHYLAAHPQCGMSTPKETHFFTKGYSANDVERYARYFADVPSSATVVGEATPTYLSVPSATERIHEVLGPQVKLIFLIRNPVDRAISAFCHVQKRSADRRSIHEALLPQTDRLNEAIRLERSEIADAHQRDQIDVRPYEHRHDDPAWNFRYLRNSCYLSDLRRFARTFGRQQMLIILAEELWQEPVSVFQRVARFLGIDSAILPDNLHRSYNRTVLTKPGLMPRLVRATARRLPGSFQWQRRLFAATLRDVPALSDADRRRLFSMFQSHNESLQEEFGLDIDSFWDPLSGGNHPGIESPAPVSGAC